METWAEVMARRPASVRPATLDWAWEREALWALELPVEPLPVARFDWLLDLPMWRHDGEAFTLPPRAVLAAPQAYPEHTTRVHEADLAFPIDVTCRNDRWIVLDGLHRLVKAAWLGLDTVDGREVPAELYERFAVGSLAPL